MTSSNPTRLHLLLPCGSEASRRILPVVRFSELNLPWEFDSCAVWLHEFENEDESDGWQIANICSTVAAWTVGWWVTIRWLVHFLERCLFLLVFGLQNLMVFLNLWENQLRIFFLCGITFFNWENNFVFVICLILVGLTYVNIKI